VFSGYGSVFGNLDSYKDVVAKGAFAASLGRKMPALLWQHRSGEVAGVYTSAKEDDHGLLMEGKLALKTQRGAEAYELMKMKAISGLSIGYCSEDEDFDHKTGIRTLKKIDLWEVSLVTFPANDAARVNSVKQIEDIKSLADVERYLREAGGFSRTEATGLIARFKAVQSDSEAEELLQLIKKRGQIFI
jgi:HK97 family phage prohead protease